MIKTISVIVFLISTSVFANCTQAPIFSLRNQEANLISLKDLTTKSKNKIILLSFFQTTCTYCITEIKYLLDLKKEKLKDNLSSFDLVLIDSKESREETNVFLDKNNFEPDEALSDPFGALDDLYKIKAFPRLFVINTNGEILKDFSANELNELRMAKKLDKVLEELITKPNCKR